MCAWKGSANQFPWFNGSTIATVDVLGGHLPLAGLFSSLMGDHVTLFMVCACEVNSLSECVLFLFSMHAPVEQGADCVCVCVHVSLHT